LVTGLGLLCLALPALCRHLGARPEFALWIGVANPLVLLYLVAGAHNDHPAQRSSGGRLHRSTRERVG
jgi:alpha-1,6-mannosyltransferase